MLVEVQLSNYGAEMMVVECWSVRRFGHGACPETPHGVLWRESPETPQSAGKPLSHAAVLRACALPVLAIAERPVIAAGGRNGLPGGLYLPLPALEDFDG
jgi:hypothetical protein